MLLRLRQSPDASDGSDAHLRLHVSASGRDRARDSWEGVGRSSRTFWESVGVLFLGRHPAEAKPEDKTEPSHVRLEYPGSWTSHLVDCRWAPDFPGACELFMTSASQTLVCGLGLGVRLKGCRTFACAKACGVSGSCKLLLKSQNYMRRGSQTLEAVLKPQPQAAKIRKSKPLQFQNV